MCVRVRVCGQAELHVCGESFSHPPLIFERPLFKAAVPSPLILHYRRALKARVRRSLR